MSNNTGQVQTIFFTGSTVPTQLKAATNEYGFDLVTNPELEADVDIVIEKEENEIQSLQNMDWRYLVHYLELRKELKTLNPTSFFRPQIEELGENEIQLYVPDKKNQIIPIDKSWASGGVATGVRMIPTHTKNTQTPDQFAWIPFLKNSQQRKKALFLDRDGILNVDKGHVYRSEDLELNEEIFELLKEAKNQGFLLIVVTNQSGIARGNYTVDQMYELHSYMQKEIENKAAVSIDGWYYCPYHPESKDKALGYYSICRKPSPGMILQAAYENNINLTASYMIGDKLSDRMTNIDLLTWLVEGVYFKESEAHEIFGSQRSTNLAPYFFYSSLSELNREVLTVLKNLRSSHNDEDQ